MDLPSCPTTRLQTAVGQKGPRGNGRDVEEEECVPTGVRMQSACGRIQGRPGGEERKGCVGTAEEGRDNPETGQGEEGVGKGRRNGGSTTRCTGRDGGANGAEGRPAEEGLKDSRETVEGERCIERIIGCGSVAEWLAAQLRGLKYLNGSRITRVMGQGQRQRIVLGKERGRIAECVEEIVEKIWSKVEPMRIAGRRRKEGVEDEGPCHAEVHWYVSGC